MIIEGYRLAKSSALTGVALIPFLGGDTYAPGYFSYFASKSMSLMRISWDRVVIGTLNFWSWANFATMFRTFIPSAFRKEHFRGVKDSFATSMA